MATPESILEHRIEPSIEFSFRKLLSQRILDVLPEISKPKDKPYELKMSPCPSNSDEILRAGQNLLTELINGYEFSHYGRHSMSFIPQAHFYKDICCLLGYEANCSSFPKKMLGYRGTLEWYRAGQDCSSEQVKEQIYDVRTFFKMILGNDDEEKSIHFKH
jgi:hypothetical protein